MQREICAIRVKGKKNVNVSAVCGQMAGPSHLNEITAAMEIPGTHAQTLVGIEK